VERWEKDEPACVELLTKDWEYMFTFHRVPSRHWRLVKTTNLLERAFLEFRRKFNGIAIMPSVDSAEQLAYAQVDILNQRWQGKQIRQWEG
jgi:transposase-like protein